MFFEIQYFELMQIFERQLQSAFPVNITNAIQKCSI